MSINMKNALLWVVAFQIIGYAMGQMTQQDMLTWYPTLHQSILTPPNLVFPIVWSILYVMLALSGALLWQYRRQPKARLALIFYTIQMLLNWAWTPLFFGLHWIGMSFLCIIAIIVFTLFTIAITRHTYKLSCGLLIPYVIWLMFAGYLNGVIWMLNA